MPIRRLPITLTVLILVGAALAGCGGDTEATTTSAAPTTSSTAAPTTVTAAATTTAPPSILTIAAPAFEDGSGIPVAHTCVLDNASPEITWTGVPAGTAALALTVVDPDAEDFVHWVIWSIPPEATGLPADLPGDPDLPGGARQALNDFAAFVEPGEPGPGGVPFKTIGYDGPCPGTVHHYVFTLYALAGDIDLPGGSAGADVVAAIEAARADGSLLAEAALTGLFGPNE
ncbi:MAG: YbhB/YbcL family Raf kinase inhibitor-like protein [Acidimicrobiia bacterium]|nr:YbhB/YbcL family Raf kinase inhibitor-like protein [Acidimicrobiia bacterium]